MKFVVAVLWLLIGVTGCIRITLICWAGKGNDARDFLYKRPDLIDAALRRMGYRFVPVWVQYPATFTSGVSFRIEMDWVNRGVGRALRDYEIHLLLFDSGNHVAATSPAGVIRTSNWIAGQNYSVAFDANFDHVNPGAYQIGFFLRDPKTGRSIALPVMNPGPNCSYRMGEIRALPARNPSTKN